MTKNRAMGQFPQFLLTTRRSRRYGEKREEEILVRRNTVGVISSRLPAMQRGAPGRVK